MADTTVRGDTLLYYYLYIYILIYCVQSWHYHCHLRWEKKKLLEHRCMGQKRGAPNPWPWPDGSSTGWWLWGRPPLWKNNGLRQWRDDEINPIWIWENNPNGNQLPPTSQSIKRKVDGENDGRIACGPVCDTLMNVTWWVLWFTGGKWWYLYSVYHETSCYTLVGILISPIYGIFTSKSHGNLMEFKRI